MLLMAVTSNRKSVMKELSAAVAKTLVALTANIQAELMEDTPVDTGWARANWVPSARAPVVRSLPEFAIHEREMKAAAVPAAQTEQSSLTASFLSALLEQPVDMYITNNVSYIIDLNDGYSVKAPPGFVQMAIIRGMKKTEAMV